MNLYYGLLGSCTFTNDSSKPPIATGSSIFPTYDSSYIGSLGFNTIGLPVTLSLVPILYLVIVCVLSALLPIATLPILTNSCGRRSAFFDSLTDAGPRQRFAHSIQAFANLLILGLDVLLIGTTVALRINASRAINAFNAANQDRSLPTWAMVGPTSQPLRPDIASTTSSQHTLQASAGTTFNMLYGVIVLLGVLFLLRKRHLHQLQATHQAKTDLEARFGRRVFAKAEAFLAPNEPLSPLGRPRSNSQHEMDQRSPPLPQYSPAPTYLSDNKPAAIPISPSARPFFPSRIGFNTAPAQTERQGDLSRSASAQTLASTYHAQAPVNNVPRLHYQAPPLVRSDTQTSRATFGHGTNAYY